MKNLKLKIALCAALLSSPLAHAENLQLVKSQIELMGARVLSSFPSAAKGYTAILAEKDGKKKMFYSTPDGHMIYGLVFNANGENLTSLDVMNATNPTKPKLLPQAVANQPEAPINVIEKPSAEEDAQAVKRGFDLAIKSKYVTEGTGKDVYVVFDPNCPYCKSLFTMTRPYLKTAKIHWIPIGLIGQDSPGKAAKILESKASEILLISSGAYKLPPVSAEIKQALINHARILEVSDSTSVPTIFYKSNNDLKMLAGMPSEQDVTKIFGR